MKKALLFLLSILLLNACKDLDTVNENNPDRNAVLTTGSDLITVLQGGYIAWWQGVHDDHPVIALSVAGDAYGMGWANFGAERFGEEPRTTYNNRATEENDYQQVVKDPWFGCLSAVSTANDVIAAIDNGISIDNGGAQDQAILAAAHFLRGVSWGYLGLLFDQTFLVNENTDLDKPLGLIPYDEVIPAAVAELDQAITLAETSGISFVHDYFNGLRLGSDEFVQLSHSYAARFLTQWPRTEQENTLVDWTEVLAHAELGLTYDFAPEADGKFWQSYQSYVFAEAGIGPFWARVDQRLVAALDPSQPTRYPEVLALGEAPLAHPQATSADKRLETDFLFLPNNNFPADRGEWHFSHYKHNRNVTDPTFAGDGSSTGPMPVFLKADNDLLQAEALLALTRTSEAVAMINAGTRVTRGELTPLSPASTPAVVERAIRYERAIELLSTAPMSLWLDRRRFGPRLDYLEVDDLGGLQIGTPAQLPVPAEELRIQGLEPYNFGGPLDPEGVERVF